MYITNTTVIIVGILTYNNLVCLVSMTSFKLGDAPFVKHVGSTTIFVRSNISQTSFKAVHF